MFQEKSMNRVRSTLLVILSIVMLVLLAYASSSVASISPQNVQVPATTLPESLDFATHSLRDPWDMSEYSDVSKNINGSGQQLMFNNLVLEKGIFSASTVNVPFAGFSVLYPGYYPATMYVDNDGAKYPISSASYKCVYFAMNTSASGFYMVSWYKDSTLQENGVSVGQITSPGQWQLYRVDLSQPPANGIAWNESPLWQGLFLTPTDQQYTRFEVDWIRLTSCSPVTTDITWEPDPAASTLWVLPSGTDRAIMVADDVDGSSGAYTLDTQGLPPGSYQVGLGTAATPPDTWSETPLVINQMPVVTFDKPSPTSGQDYATQQGNPWDFSDEADTPLVRTQEQPGALQWFYADGLLDLTTPSGTQSLDLDPQVYLNVPESFNGNQYRYLTFRMYTEWFDLAGNYIPWPNGPGGMVARWIWITPSLAGAEDQECIYVGEDIPYDIGWVTYTIDLFDIAGLGGVVELLSNSPPHCPADISTASWATTSSIEKVRFDPNENVTQILDTITGGGPFHQQLDWIKLTSVDQGQQGEAFPIKLSVNKPMQQDQFTFYYTTDRAQPTQNPAVILDEQPPDPETIAFFLPIVGVDRMPPITYPAPQSIAAKPLWGKASATPTTPPITSVTYESTEDASNELTFWWDTTSVPAAQYYLCVSANDGLNNAIYCSEAPLNIQ